MECVCVCVFVLSHKCNKVKQKKWIRKRKRKLPFWFSIGMRNRSCCFFFLFLLKEKRHRPRFHYKSSHKHFLLLSRAWFSFCFFFFFDSLIHLFPLSSLSLAVLCIRSLSCTYYFPALNTTTTWMYTFCSDNQAVPLTRFPKKKVTILFLVVFTRSDDVFLPFLSLSFVLLLYQWLYFIYRVVGGVLGRRCRQE